MHVENSIFFVWNIERDIYVKNIYVKNLTVNFHNHYFDETLNAFPFALYHQIAHILDFICDANGFSAIKRLQVHVNMHRYPVSIRFFCHLVCCGGKKTLKQ